MPVLIGYKARVSVYDQPNDESISVYISLGEYDDEKNTDEFGVPDDQIFYYATKEEVENNDCFSFDILSKEEVWK